MPEAERGIARAATPCWACKPSIAMQSFTVHRFAAAAAMDAGIGITAI